MGVIREHWTSKIGFLFAAVGSAVGLGVLWKFPYTVGQNGGGLFLLAYILCVLLIGIPLFMGELLIGKYSQKAAITGIGSLSHNKPFWKLSGWFGVISSFLIMSFYSVVAGWGMSYVLMSITGFYKGLNQVQIQETFTLLSQSGGICLFWHFLFTLITMVIVFSGVKAGIEKWANVMTKSLFIILLILVFFSMRLEGFSKALHFIFYPNLSSFNLSSVLEALGLAFFTLSLGQGIMFSYGSYMKKEDKIFQMSLYVAGALIIIAILAALTVFPIVFTFNAKPSFGTGLIFQTLPFLFTKLPGSQLIAILFFVLFVFTAITSSVAFIEVVATNFMEMFFWERKKAVLTVACTTFIFGIPSVYAASGGFFIGWQDIYGSNFLDTMDNIVSVWIIPIGGLITTLFIGWRLDQKAVLSEVIEGSRASYNFWCVWHFAMKWIIPFMIILIILQKSGLVNFNYFFG